MHTSPVCGASGAFLLLGGWAGVMWAFLRSLSLHLQICWQVLVGRNFMIFAQAAGWGVPIIGIALALVFSGVSFRFGPTCHINHKNSLADFWIPLLIFAGATVVLTFATFGYCVKVYLASLSDNSASTEGSNLPTYTNNSQNKNISPRQAYRRVRRVIALQWRGIAIVLIIIADVIFFSIVYVFQDTVVQSVKDDPKKGTPWVMCLMGSGGDKNKCLDEASSLVINEATTFAVLLLLGVSSPSFPSTKRPMANTYTSSTVSGYFSCLADGQWFRDGSSCCRLLARRSSYRLMPGLISNKIHVRTRCSPKRRALR